MSDIPNRVFCCEKLHRCTWQAAALHQGLSWGVIQDTSPAWRKAHAEHCGGRLIQFDLREAIGATSGRN